MLKITISNTSLKTPAVIVAWVVPGWFMQHEGIGTAEDNSGNVPRERLHAAFSARKNGDIEQAYEMYRAILADYPDQPEALRQLGFTCSMRYKERECREHLQRAIQVDGDNYLHYMTLGMALSNLWRLPEALEHYHKAEQLKRDDPLLYHKIAITYQQTGRLNDALGYCHKAIKLKQGYADVYLTLFDIFNRQNKFHATLAYAQSVKKIIGTDDAEFIEKLQKHISHARQSRAIQQLVPLGYRHPLNGPRPVFVLSSVMRSGSTLLQRLLNSSKKALIYGENWHLISRQPEGIWFAAREHGLYSQSHEKNHERMGKAEDFFTYNLFPDTEGYLRLVIGNFYRTLEYYGGCAEKAGFPRWGMKDPRSADWMHVMRLLIPHGRFVFLYRNILDAARSFKARGHYRKPHELAKVASQWRNALNNQLQTDAANIMLLKYEDLVANPGHELSRLEDFTGLHGIDRRVMKRKINIHDRVIDSGYVEPAQLDNEEYDLIVKHAGGVMRRTGYLETTE